MLKSADAGGPKSMILPRSLPRQGKCYTPSKPAGGRFLAYIGVLEHQAAEIREVRVHIIRQETSCIPCEVAATLPRWTLSLLPSVLFMFPLRLKQVLESRRSPPATGHMFIPVWCLKVLSAQGTRLNRKQTLML